MSLKIKDLPNEEYFTGSLGCAGCGGILAARQALKVLGPDSIMVMPACCVVTVSCYAPQFPFKVPMIVMAFAATGAAVSGMVVGLRRQGKAHVNVVGFAGDGGTADIGLQSLSGAVERGEKFLYICYDNVAYMNTGVQRSSTTPYGALTATTPGGSKRMFEGNTAKKDVCRMLVAQGIAYAATASVAYPEDYLRKIEQALAVDGPSYLHVHAPCPPGWGYAPSDTIRVGRLAVQTGLWQLMEWENGRERINLTPARRRPVADYLSAQSRFRDLRPDDVATIQSRVDRQFATPAEQES
ncbi:MAG: thiamine pyrophosphate-dependent enzyme [Chloroflexota bacterium]